MSKSAVLLAQEFRQLQENRVKAYVVLSEAHRKYLQTAPDYDFKGYQKEVAKATDTFRDVSKRILKIKGELGDSDLADFINQVQACEEKKLRLTVQYQLAKQKMQDEEDNTGDEIKKLKNEIDNIVEEINESLEEIRYIVVDLQTSESEEETER